MFPQKFDFPNLPSDINKLIYRNVLDNFIEENLEGWKATHRFTFISCLKDIGFLVSTDHMFWSKPKVRKGCMWVRDWYLLDSIGTEDRCFHPNKGICIGKFESIDCWFLPDYYRYCIGPFQLCEECCRKQVQNNITLFASHTILFYPNNSLSKKIVIKVDWNPPVRKKRRLQILPKVGRV